MTTIMGKSPIQIGLLLAFLVGTPGLSMENNANYIAFGLVSPEYVIDITRRPTDLDRSYADINYSPNQPYSLSTELSVAGVTINYAFDIPDTDEGTGHSVDQKVISKFTEYGISYFLARIGFEASFVSLKGLDMTFATGEGASRLNEDPYTHRNDFVLSSRTLNFWLEPIGFNLDIDHILDPASLPQGSGLGLLACICYDELRIKTNDPIIPDSYREPYGADAGLTKAKLTSIAAAIGPGFNLELFGFYLSGVAIYGTGTQSTDYRVDEKNIKGLRMSEKTKMYVNLGYKDKSLFTYIDYQLDNPSYTLDTIYLATSRGVKTWTIGARF